MKNKKPFLCRIGIHWWVTIVTKNTADIIKKVKELINLNKSINDESVYDYGNWPVAAVKNHTENGRLDDRYIKVCLNCEKISNTIHENLVLEYNKLHDDKYVAQKAWEIFNKNKENNI